jgi:hypothetical protein
MVKKKGEAAPGVSSSAEQLNAELKAQIPALEKALEEEIYISKETLRLEAEKKGRLEMAEKDHLADQARTHAIGSDMAREYKAIQEFLINQVNNFETELTELKEEQEMAKYELSLVTREKDDEITSKEHLIASLKSKINEMGAEFTQMLQLSISLMKQKMAEISGEHQPIVSPEDALNDKGKVAYLQRLSTLTNEINK